MILTVLVCMNINCERLSWIFATYLLGTGSFYFLPGFISSRSMLVLNWEVPKIFIGGTIIFLIVLFKFQPLEKLFEKRCEPFVDAVVSVRNIDGNIALKRRGKVRMHVGETKTEDVDSKGDAHFQNLRVGQKAKLSLEEFDFYKPVFPDSVYTITNNTHFELKVYIPGLQTLYGKVLYRGTPVPNVLITLKDLRTTTDSSGNFQLSIPDTLRNERYSLDFFKKDFLPYQEIVNAPLDQPLAIDLQKQGDP